MRLQAKVTFAMRDLDRLKCIQAVIDRQLKVYQAAERLGLTSRQVLRLVRRYNAEGPIGLIDRHRNRPNNSRLKADLAERAFEILRSQYPDFGPTLASEKLRERHGIGLAVETVRQLMVADGLAVSQTTSTEDPATAISLSLLRSGTGRSRGTALASSWTNSGDAGPHPANRADRTIDKRR